MASDDLAEENLVFDLDAGHVQKIFDAIVHFKFFGKDSGVLILDGVFAFETAGEVHRHKPARKMAGHTEGPADGPENLFADCSRPRPELLQPFTDTPPVVPLFGLDLFYPLSFGRIFEALPMPAIGIRRRDLAGVGVLKDPDQIFSGFNQTAFDFTGIS